MWQVKFLRTINSCFFFLWGSSIQWNQFFDSCFVSFSVLRSKTRKRTERIKILLKKYEKILKIWIIWKLWDLWGISKNIYLAQIKRNRWKLIDGSIYAIGQYFMHFIRARDVFRGFHSNFNFVLKYLWKLQFNIKRTFKLPIQSSPSDSAKNWIIFWVTKFVKKSKIRNKNSFVWHWYFHIFHNSQTFGCSWIFRVFQPGLDIIA